MGWAFVFLGLLTIAIGSFMLYYGQDLVRNPPKPTQVERRVILAPVQERLLELLVKYQRQFATHKLVVSRVNGGLHFDGEPEKGADINLIQELYGEGDEAARAAQFEELMESMPTEYVRFYGETRLDNPFVVSVTEPGMAYLRR